MNTMGRTTQSFLTTNGLGHLPISGTVGSIPPVVLAIILIFAGLGPGTSLSWVYFLTMTLILVVYSASCILYGHEAEAKWGKDPSEVVADETAGQAITLMMIPAGMLGSPLAILCALAGAFVLFRLFDIFKPWPAGAMQKLPGGWGILLDDIFASIMAGVVIMFYFAAIH